MTPERMAEIQATMDYAVVCELLDEIERLQSGAVLAAALNQIHRLRDGIDTILSQTNDPGVADIAARLLGRKTTSELLAECSTPGLVPGDPERSPGRGHDLA